MSIIQRDHYGRPLITPLGGGKPTAYTRCTTFVGALEDTYNLEQWKCRQVALGLAARPDLMGLVHAANGEARELNRVVADALDASKSDAAANTGTTLHAMTELVDAGADVASIPEQYRADMDAYLKATSLLRHDFAEVLTVHDGLKIAGTPDRISTLPDGRRVIVDLKTGRIDYAVNKIAMQLAVYANSLLYDVDTHERTEHHADKTIGIIVHLPAGSGECTLHKVDLTAGWEAVQIAKQVRDWRSRKGIGSPFEFATPPVIDVAPATDVILEQIESSDSVDQLEGVYALHMGEWTDYHTAAAAARKAKLTGVSA